MVRDPLERVPRWPDIEKNHPYTPATLSAREAEGRTVDMESDPFQSLSLRFIGHWELLAAHLKRVRATFRRFYLVESGVKIQGYLCMLLL